MIIKHALLINRFIALLLISLRLCSSTNDTQLVYVFHLFRHGNRESVYSDSLGNAGYFNGRDELSPDGMR